MYNHINIIQSLNIEKCINKCCNKIFSNDVLRYKINFLSIYSKLENCSNAWNAWKAQIWSYDAVSFSSGYSSVFVMNQSYNVRGSLVVFSSFSSSHLHCVSGGGNSSSAKGLWVWVCVRLSEVQADETLIRWPRQNPKTLILCAIVWTSTLSITVTLFQLSSITF